MNDNMRAIATKAFEFAYSVCKEEGRPGGHEDHIWSTLAFGKLAELIIEECIDKVDKTGFVFNEQPQYNDKQNALVSEGFFWALESVKQQIKEHFGVEE